MHLIDLTTSPLPAAAATDPLTLIYGGQVVGAGGSTSQADIVISSGLIAEIGSLVCLPAGAELIDASGSLVRLRRGDAPLEPGQIADVELVSLDAAGS